MYFYRVLILCVGLMVSGCVHQVYPEKWSPLLSKLDPDGCNGLSGTYRDLPVGLANSSIGLFDMLTKYGGYARDFDSVKISSTGPDHIRFEAYKDGKIRKDFNVSESEGTLICKEYGADLPMSGVYGAQEVLVISKKQIGLRKDSAGNLILLNEETGIALYGPIPLPGSDKQWFRFIPYKDK